MGELSNVSKEKPSTAGVCVDKSQALVVRAIEAGLQESAAERTGRVVKMAVSLPKEAPAIYVSHKIHGGTQQTPGYMSYAAEESS